jgi:hypothetical protein
MLFFFANTTLAQQPNTLDSCSVSWNTTTTLKIENNHDKYIDVYWMNYQCKEQLYSTVPPGGTLIQPTFVSHPWRIRENGSGKILKQVTPTTSATKVIAVHDACSAGYSDPAQLEIYNNTGSSVDIYWKDYKCRERYYLTLRAGKKQLLYTFATHPWRIRKTNSGTILKDIQISSTKYTRVAVSESAKYNRANDTSYYQTHLVYVLPSDRVNEQLDRNGAMTTSVAAAQKWLDQQSDGQRLQIDTYGGALDTSFIRLDKTDAEMIQEAVQKYGNAAFLREVIESELHARGFNDDGTLYVAYYGGSSPYACGGASHPPDGPQGNVVALYLWGEPPGAIPCHNNAFAADEDSPGYWEFSLIHEVFHALGAVANPASPLIPDQCAPNSTNTGHVFDSPTDLMYAGVEPWRPSVLDFGNDDYFNHGNPYCGDIARSVFLRPAATLPEPPPGWQ